MKQRCTAAITAASMIVLISCNWFKSNKKETTNPLVGQWILDSIVAGKDTSAAFMAAVLLGHNTVFDFKKDTVITISEGRPDTSFYNWNGKDSQLIPADPVSGNFRFTRINDSTVTLTSTDSTVFFLGKK